MDITWEKIVLQSSTKNQNHRKALPDHFRLVSTFVPRFNFTKNLKKQKKKFFIKKKIFFQKCLKTLNNTEDPLVHIVVNFFSIPQSRLGDMASLPVPNCLSLVLYLQCNCKKSGMTLFSLSKLPSLESCLT